MLKVMVACGCGMGTSQIMKTRAQQVLKELGIQATIHHTIHFICLAFCQVLTY